ncbi:MAG: DUF2007 domain-containing protein [Sphingomonadales bacterium]|nr:DUF2007 domain-containing protein [Sphingomonadales bacterium]
MKKVYSHENLAIVSNAKSLLELNNIDCLIKNEFHASGGHVGFEAIPIELWVQDDAKATEAISILENELAPDDPQSSWICSHCGEKNDGSFEICWKCQKGH